MGLNTTSFTLKARGYEFFNDELSCLGWQFSEILVAVREYTDRHDWYIFDALGSSQSSLFELFPKNSEGICVVPSTEALIGKVKKVIQFESGVFMAFEKGDKTDWDFRHLPETEECEGLQHPLANIEIRTFDYSFFEVYGRSLEVKNAILNHFNKT